MSECDLIILSESERAADLNYQNARVDMIILSESEKAADLNFHNVRVGFDYTLEV
jgi:hypothetical protein